MNLTINSNNLTITILVVYLIMCTIWFLKEGIHGLILQTILFRYLKKNYYKLWQKITSIGNFGPGLNNPIRYFRWLYIAKQPDDEKLLRLTDSLKIRLRYMLFLSLGVISGIILTAITLS